MERYLFLFLLIVFFFYPPLTNAENICYLPESPTISYRSIIKETKTETLKINDYLVIFFFYDTNSSILKHPMDEFHFNNILKLAELKWGKSEIDLNDYFDEDGNTRPYVFVEMGGTIKDGFFLPMKGFARIRTCYDCQNDNPKENDELYFFLAVYYENIIDSINNVFTPLVAVQAEKEKRK